MTANVTMPLSRRERPTVMETQAPAELIEAYDASVTALIAVTYPGSFSGNDNPDTWLADIARAALRRAEADLSRWHAAGMLEDGAL